MSRARGVALIVLLALAGAAGLWHARGRASSSMESATGAPVRPPSPDERLRTLDHSLRAIADGVRDTPRDRWDPAAVVRHVGRNPDTLCQWVREHTAWIPYRGLLRGPVGVLMDRQGNSLDRAVLLTTLLTEAGHTARLARAALPVERARQDLPDLVSRRPGVAPGELTSAAVTEAPVGEVAARYQLDGSAIEHRLAEYDAGTARLLSDLDRRVSGQTARLLAAVSGPDPAAEWQTRHDSALAALQDHWWVQVKRGESWEDLDLLPASAPDAGTVPLIPLETVAPAEISTSLVHTIAVRVIEERLAGGALTEQRTLEHVVRPAAVIGRPVVLQFWPAAWPNRAPASDAPSRATRQLALAQDAWSASLVIGSEVMARTMLRASSGVREGAPGLGGLGDAIASGLGGRDRPVQAGPDSLLTAVWIEYRMDVPGREPRVVRRRVFDLIGPAARETWTPQRTVALDERQRLARSLALMMRTEILPVAAQLAPDFVLYLGGRSLLANAGLLRAVTRPDFGADRHAADSLLRQAEAGVSPLYTLAILRQDALGEQVFIDRPGILTRHQYPAALGEHLALEDATDIVANEVGVVLGESDGFAARVAQGVWDTNLEALLGAGSRAAANTALAYDAPGDWRVLTPSGLRHPSSGLPADAETLLQHERQSGYTIVAPAAPVAVAGEAFTGWWRIHPETGDALGIAGNGWGQAAPDYTMHLAAFVEMAKPFVFAYALCQYIPQAANSLNILGSEFWRRGLSPAWTGRPQEGRDFEDVAVENSRRCVIDAILAGFVATAPLLLRTLTSRTEAELSAGLRSSRGRVTLPALAAPPGTRVRPQGYPSPAGGAAVRGPGGTLPGGAAPAANPFAKTEPGVRPTIPGPPPIRTRPGPPPTPRPSPAPPRPPTPLSREDLIKAAKDRLADAISAEARAEAAYQAAARQSYETTRDFVQYRAGKRASPATWDPNVDADLLARNWAAHGEAAARLNDLRQAERATTDAIAGVRKAEGRGGFPPPRPAPPQPPAPGVPNCPPKCAGNDNPTGPAAAVQMPHARPSAPGALQVGSVGAANSVSPTVKVDR